MGAADIEGGGPRSFLVTLITKYCFIKFELHPLQYRYVHGLCNIDTVALEGEESGIERGEGVRGKWGYKKRREGFETKGLKKGGVIAGK